MLRLFGLIDEDGSGELDEDEFTSSLLENDNQDVNAWVFMMTTKLGTGRHF